MKYNLHLLPLGVVLLATASAFLFYVFAFASLGIDPDVPKPERTQQILWRMVRWPDPGIVTLPAAGAFIGGFVLVVLSARKSKRE